VILVLPDAVDQKTHRCPQDCQAMYAGSVRKCTPDQKFPLGTKADKNVD